MLSVQIKGFRGKVVCVIVSTFLIFHVCWSVVTCLCILSCTLCTIQLTPKNNGGFPLSLPLKSQKIDIQQLSLLIFSDFRYQSIKITWLLPIFIDTDLYRLTTPGMHNNKQYFPTIDNFTRAQRGVQFYLRRNPPGNWVILIFREQKLCTRIILSILRSFLHFSRAKDVINHL